MILIGFAFAFMNLQHIDTIDSEVSTRYSSPAMAVLSSFSMMMGSFNVEDFTPDPTAERVTVFVVFMVFRGDLGFTGVLALLGTRPCSMAHAGGRPRLPGFHVDMCSCCVFVLLVF